MALLEIKNLTFSYPGRRDAALHQVNFAIDKGDFVTICGPTGSGKSTLLRMLKREVRPLGQLAGEILFNGTSLDALDDRVCASSIGYVMQRPEQQIVSDKVWHELAFGLENMGIERDTIRRRVSEMAEYFGISDWFDKNVSELSGGQKQLLNLASVMVMQPDMLLLDEPTAQLDPISAKDFVATVHRLNRELSVTVLMIEHRLEEVIPLSDKLLVLENGTVRDFGKTRACVQRLKNDAGMLEYMPAAVRIFSHFDISDVCPLDIREGRGFLERNFKREIRSLEIPSYTHSNSQALEFEEVFFRYGRNLPDVLHGLNFTVYENEIFCILGGNGSGKSTTLAAASALIVPYSGCIRVFGKNIKQYKNQMLYNQCLTLLPQDVQTVFLRNTVREELSGADLTLFPYDLTGLLDSHPYDLSGGQQQLVALAKVLATKPRLLLLDEPTKGLDAHNKAIFIDVIKKLRQQGMTIVCVTHDVEFASVLADRCALFFRGEITSCDVPRRFFPGNSFYTTAASHMTRGLYENVATVDDAVALLDRNGGYRP